MTDTFKIGDELEVRRLGFGAMRITGQGIWGPPEDPDAARAVLKRVIELGTNLIDTADSYGPEVSENLIAETLHPYPNDLVIATKGGLKRSGPGQWERDCRPERLKQCCDASLQRLKLEQIPLYQLHAVDDKLPYEEQVGALRDLQAEGKIRHIGVCNVGRTDLKTAREVAEIVSVQNRFNLIDRGAENVLEACEADGLAFIPWFPLATGDLAKGDGPLAEIAKRKNAKPSQIALAWLLQRSRVMLPIPGTSSVEHLEENVEATRIQLSEEEMAELGALA